MTTCVQGIFRDAIFLDAVIPTQLSDPFAIKYLSRLRLLSVAFVLLIWRCIDRYLKFFSLCFCLLQLPVLDTASLTSVEELRCAHTFLTFLTNGYVWQNGDADVAKVPVPLWAWSLSDTLAFAEMCPLWQSLAKESVTLFIYQFYHNSRGLDFDYCNRIYNPAS